MEKDKIDELVQKFVDGLVDDGDIKQIESLIEEGLIDPVRLQGNDLMEDRLMKMESPAPSFNLDDQFYKMLLKARKESKGFFWISSFSWPELAPRLALASFILVAGVAIGFFARSSSGNGSQITELSRQVSDLKEMMLFTLLEKESASERLKAVSMTRQFDQVSDKVATALFKTLNEDENVNVRLAALEALVPYAKVSAVRESLVRSIGRQTSPFVQVALAEVMVGIQEKSSVVELQKILQNEKTPKDVKSKIKQSIDILI